MKLIERFMPRNPAAPDMPSPCLPAADASQRFNIWQGPPPTTLTQELTLSVLLRVALIVYTRP